jgi:hypothetical protein
MFFVVDIVLWSKYTNSRTQTSNTTLTHNDDNNLKNRTTCLSTIKDRDAMFGRFRRSIFGNDSTQFGLLDSLQRWLATIVCLNISSRSIIGDELQYLRDGFLRQLLKIVVLKISLLLYIWVLLISAPEHSLSFLLKEIIYVKSKVFKFSMRWLHISIKSLLKVKTYYLKCLKSAPRTLVSIFLYIYIYIWALIVFILLSSINFL